MPARNLRRETVRGNFFASLLMVDLFGGLLGPILGVRKEINRLLIIRALGRHRGNSTLKEHRDVWGDAPLASENSN